MLFEIRTDSNDLAGVFQYPPLETREKTEENPGIAETEIFQLLGKARMHIVNMGDPHYARKENTPETGFLMRMNQIIPFFKKLNKRPEKQKEIERDLCRGRTDFHPAHTGDSGDSQKADIRHIHRLAHGVCYKINGMSHIREGFQPSHDTHRGSPGLKDRLRSDTQPP